MDLIAIKEEMIKAIVEEWMLAGHNLNGSFVKSLEAKEEQITDGVRIDIIGNEYGIYTSTGVTAEKIPYTRGSGRGGKSKYITGLMNYAKARMGISDDREALGVAFAIAEKHKKEGMKGSGYLDHVTEKHLERFEELAGKYFEVMITNILEIDGNN
jgi:hypothetical protein